MNKRNYDPAFKAEVVKLSHRRENLRELADELDIPVQRIYKWRRAAKDGLMPKSNGPRCFSHGTEPLARD